MWQISSSELDRLNELMEKIPKRTPEEIECLTDAYINVDIGYPAKPEEIAKAMEKIIKEKMK